MSLTATVIGGVIGIVASAIGAGIAGRYALKRTKIQLEHDKEKWYADHFVERKVDRLEELSVALETAQDALNTYANYPPRDEAEYSQEVGPKVDEYIRLKRQAQPYIDDEELNDALDEAMAQFRIMDDIVVSKIPNCDKAAGLAEGKDHTQVHFDFIEAYKEARNKLSEQINPEIVQDLENELSNADSEQEPEPESNRSEAKSESDMIRDEPKSESRTDQSEADHEKELE